jgi:hypothetical protein
MKREMSPILKYTLSGVVLSAAFTVIIGVTAMNLGGFEIVGKSVPFAYAWRLAEPTAWSRLTAWSGYILHNLLAWIIIFMAQREGPKYSLNLRWFNWSMLVVNAGFALLHILQTRFFYDGLAQDVPELTALGSVALMLIIILILETPRRGLIFGKKIRFHERFLQVLRKYHGYLFSWAVIYTFWYHPTEGTWGHLMGFFYMFMLFTQSALIFNRAHLNKWWTFTLEVFVLVHGVAVAIFQGNSMWPMFAFGFGAMLVLTQMYGLGLNTWQKRGLAVLFVIAAPVTYALMGRLPAIHEVIRIPVLDYLVVFMIYIFYLAIDGLLGLFKRRGLVQSHAE